MQAKRMHYGDDGHYDCASAFIKSMRGSDPDAAVYWAARMLASGEDPRFIARRIVIFASEDVGNADPRALELTLAALASYERLGSPEGELALAQAVLYLASVPKSDAAYKAFNQAMAFVKDSPSYEVPMHIRNAPTGLMKNMGYGDGYRHAHRPSFGQTHLISLTTSEKRQSLLSVGRGFQAAYGLPLDGG